MISEMEKNSKSLIILVSQFLKKCRKKYYFLNVTNISKQHWFAYLFKESLLPNYYCQLLAL